MLPKRPRIILAMLVNPFAASGQRLRNKLAMSRYRRLTMPVVGQCTQVVALYTPVNPLLIWPSFLSIWSIPYAPPRTRANIRRVMTRLLRSLGKVVSVACVSSCCPSSDDTWPLFSWLAFDGVTVRQAAADPQRNGHALLGDTD